jgi:DNA (cytosine-5)-methyltransferase 1
MIIANINPSGNGINGNIHDCEDIAPTMTTNKGEGIKVIVAMRGRNPDNPSDRTVGIPTEQRLEPNSQGICNTVTSVQKDNMVMETGINSRYRIRKLTPMECWRIMDFSDEDFHKAEAVNSNTQLYKQAGNSIVRNVLVAIFGQMIPGKENVYKEGR